MSEEAAENIEDFAAPDPVVRLAFVMNVHTLIQLGFDRIRTRDFHNSPEEEITGSLTEAIDAVLEDPSAPEWAIHIDIHEEKRLNDGDRLGKNRLRLDFEFVRTQRGRRPRFILEAKRLGPNHHIRGEKGYLGPEGMGAFLSGEYARDQLDAGMLGYVQSQTADDWRNQLAAQLSNALDDYAIEPDGGWREFPISDCESITHRTIHRRQSSRGSITIYHTLIDFCSKSPDMC